jgi:predicted phosphodiesterase
MNIGLMSDLHGNAHATRAVLADSAQFSISQWCVLGDIVALGPDPVETIELVAALPGLVALSGNTERYVLTGDRPYPSLADVANDPSLLPRLIEVASSFSWTRGAITQAGWYAWIVSLPGKHRMTIPDGTRVLLVHASPRSDDGPGIDTQISDEDLRALLIGSDADVVIGGHTHDVTDRIIEGIRAINLGSVSNAHRPDRAATYGILRCWATGYEYVPRIVPYDHEAVLRRIDEVVHPASTFLKRFQVPAE